MNAQTERLVIAGPAGDLALSLDAAAHGLPARGLAVIAHPHPLFGGTMDNKVVQTLVRAFTSLGYRCVRFNFRGVAPSAGAWDEGHGEIDDMLAVIQAQRQAGEPLVLAGFSFGGYVTSQAARRLAEAGQPADRLVLIAPATSRFDVAPVPDDTLVIHGEADDTVPLQATLDWARPQALPVVVPPGVGHFFHGQLTLLKQIVVRAFGGA